ncbi:MAG TPA: type II and III secretion system protein, partial [Terriglobales bacterium]
DVKVYQVSRSAARQIGTDVPRSFTAFNVPTEAQKLLGNQSIQQIIDQLVGSGAINQAGSTALAALIAQGISGQNSIFSQPFGVFGGGITLTGLTLPPGTLHLNFNSSELRSLEHVTLRASHGNSADFRIGTRYPIINASFAPIYNSSSITKVLSNKSYIPPVPSFTYEDLGIILKTKPQVSANDVRLDFELEIRSLGATSFNGIPIINNREYKGAISAADGQSIVIGGLLTSTEQNNLTGLPLLSRLPGIGVAFSTQNKTQEDDELLVVLTPHIVRPHGMTAQEIRLPASASR